MALTSTDISPDVRALADRLNAAAMGEVIEYHALSDVIGIDVTRHRYLVLSAMRIALRETGAAFANVRRVGYKRLTGAEAAHVGSTARRRVRNTCRRSSRTMTRMLETTNDMPRIAQLAALQELTAVNMLKHLAADKPVRALPVEEKPMPVGHAFRAMMKAMGAS